MEIFKFTKTNGESFIIEDSENLRDALKDCIMNLQSFRVWKNDTIVFFSNSNDLKRMMEVTNKEEETTLVDYLTNRIEYAMGQ